MSYTQLRAYTERLRASGLDVVKQQVALWRKLSFPFVTLIMTLLAVPFAVTIGRSGAMAGIGVAIGIAIVYWTTISVFAAMGAGGVMAPALAAWAPNLLFGAGALYLLTDRPDLTSRASSASQFHLVQPQLSAHARPRVDRVDHEEDVADVARGRGVPLSWLRADASRRRITITVRASHRHRPSGASFCPVSPPGTRSWTQIRVGRLDCAVNDQTVVVRQSLGHRHRERHERALVFGPAECISQRTICVPPIEGTTSSAPRDRGLFSMCQSVAGPSL